MGWRQEELPGGSGGGGGGESPPAGGRAGALGRTVGIEELLGRRLAVAEAKSAPPAVHVAGAMGLPLPRPRVSVIGSRDAPPDGLAAARAVSRTLSDAGATVVSGLAAGVDAVAHRGAM